MEKPLDKRWLVLTPGKTLQASTEFRIIQLQPLMADLGHNLEILPAHQAGNLELQKYDGIIIQKVLPKNNLYQQIRSMRGPTIFDLDDAVWIGASTPKWHHRLRRIIKTRKLGRSCTAITAANKTLGNYFRLQQKVHIVPMALDSKVWQAKSQWSETITLGWAGAPGNLGMIESLDPVLSHILRKHPQVELAIYSGARPKLSCPYKFIPYRQDQLAQTIRSFSIGLVPLPDTKFASAKSPIKALQYMASGLPFIGSPQPGLTEMTGSIAAATYAQNHTQWVQGLEKLIRQPKQLAELGQSGRQQFESKYSAHAVSSQWAQILHNTHQRYFSHRP
jgi:hypothetical protein